MRNKAYRKHKELSKWIRRTKYWMMNESFIWDDEGHKVYNQTITDCLKSHHSKMYKNTGTPCSCSMCSYLKYDRKEIKKETRFLLKQAS